jgi:hypothetical protein
MPRANPPAPSSLAKTGITGTIMPIPSKAIKTESSKVINVLFFISIFYAALCSLERNR